VDRFCGLFCRFISSLPTCSTPASVQRALWGPADPINTTGILADALKTFVVEDMGTARDVLSANAIKINAAIDEAHACASELQQLCAEKRWLQNYKGHQVYVSDRQDKVVQLLDKTESVGDIVVNVDLLNLDCLGREFGPFLRSLNLL
jgi:hypothetical protein